MRGRGVAVAGVIVYVAIATWVVLETPRRVTFGGDEWLMLALAVASVFAGAAIGRWRALVLVAVPFAAGVLEQSYEIFFEAAYASLFPLALGVALRHLRLPRRAPRPFAVAVVVGYVAFFAAVTYLVLDTARADDPFWTGFGSLIILLGVPFAAGVFLGQWSATLLSIVPVLVAWPAGDNPHIEGDITAPAFTLGFGIPFFFGAIAAGVALQRLLHRRALVSH